MINGPRLYLTKRVRFSAAHRHAPAGREAAAADHGHTYTIEATAGGCVDGETGMVLDIGFWKKIIVEEVASRFDHRHLDDDCPELAGRPATPDQILRVIWELLSKALPPGIALARLGLIEGSRDRYTRTEGIPKLPPTPMLAHAYRFCASHRLYNPDFSGEKNRRIYGKCANPHGHGHNYTLEVGVTGPVDPKTGMVCELPELSSAVQAEVLDPIDHRHLNYEFKGLAGRVPTSENLLLALWPRLAARLRNAKLWRLCLFETPYHTFEFYGEGIS